MYIPRAAGAYSTTNDLAKIGRAILNSTLTSKAVTRRWFSTSTFVDSLDQAAGRGWEIFRREVNGHTVDVYTKAGNCTFTLSRSVTRPLTRLSRGIIHLRLRPHPLLQHRIQHPLHL